jgi:hypothetical protein
MIAGLGTSAITSATIQSSQSTAGTDVSNVEPVKQTIEAYTSWLSRSGKPDKTVSNTKKLLIAIVFETMGCDHIDEFNADITVQFIEQQQEAEYASRTIKTQLFELKRFSKWLVSSGRIKSDPIANMTFEVDESESADRAQVRFQRLFAMIEFVSNSRFGVSPKAINDHCCEVSHVCERTTRRDIDLLIAIGTFRKEITDGSFRKDRASRSDSITIKLNPFSRLSQLASK